MGNVFYHDIIDHASWSGVFQSIPAFELLIRRISGKENITCHNISHLTPGSNAVFKVDDHVVKIFAPVLSGINTDDAYSIEISGMRRATDLGIRIPKILAASSILDKYLFQYIIMDYIDGSLALNVLKNLDYDKKIDFVHQIRSSIYKMNTLVSDKIFYVDIKENALSDLHPCNKLPDDIFIQRKGLLDRYDMSDKVYVHGDITGDNVMVTQNGEVYILDFADGRAAPSEYEYAPILFDLFDFDKTMIREFIGSNDAAVFAEKCFYGLLMHEFGGGFIRNVCKRILGIEIDETDDLMIIKEALVRFFSDKFTQ
jgi:serine/threonine protein kinase